MLVPILIAAAGISAAVAIGYIRGQKDGNAQSATPLARVETGVPKQRCEIMLNGQLTIVDCDSQEAHRYVQQQARGETPATGKTVVSTEVQAATAIADAQERARNAEKELAAARRASDLAVATAARAAEERGRRLGELAGEQSVINRELPGWRSRRHAAELGLAAALRTRSNVAANWPRQTVTTNRRDPISGGFQFARSGDYSEVFGFTVSGSNGEVETPTDPTRVFEPIGVGNNVWSARSVRIREVYPWERDAANNFRAAHQSVLDMRAELSLCNGEISRRESRLTEIANEVSRNSNAAKAPAASTVPLLTGFLTSRG